MMTSIRGYVQIIIMNFVLGQGKPKIGQKNRDLLDNCTFFHEIIVN